MGWGPSGPAPLSPSRLTEGRGLAHLLVPSTHSRVKDGKLDQRATGGPSAGGEEQLVMPREGGSSLGLLLLESQNLSGSRVGLLQAVGSPWDPSPKRSIGFRCICLLPPGVFHTRHRRGGGWGGRLESNHSECREPEGECSTP